MKDKDLFSRSRTILWLGKPQNNLFLYWWNPRDQARDQRLISLCSPLLSSTVNMGPNERHKKGECWRVGREKWNGLRPWGDGKIRGILYPLPKRRKWWRPAASQYPTPSLAIGGGTDKPFLLCEGNPVSSTPWALEGDPSEHLLTRSSQRECLSFLHQEALEVGRRGKDGTSKSDSVP